MTSKNQDIITEAEYTNALKNVRSDPELDSPGDSEADAGMEFKMGLNYKNKESELVDLFEDSQDEYEEIPVLEKIIPKSQQVISASQPAPWMDLEKESDTN